MQETRLDGLEARMVDMEQDLAAIKAQFLRQFPIDPGFVAESLNLTPGESRVAVALAEGGTVRSIAESTGRAEQTARWFLRQIYRKQRYPGLKTGDEAGKDEQLAA